MMRVVGSDKVIDKGLSDSIGGPLREGSSLRFKLDNGGPEEWGEHDFGGAKGEMLGGAGDRRRRPQAQRRTPKTER